MARKKITGNIKNIITQEIDYKNLDKKVRRLDRSKEKTIISRLKRTGNISVDQYKELFGEEPYYSPNLIYYKISEASTNIKVTFDNFDKFRNSIFIAHKSNIKESKIYHNYTNIDNIIKFKNRVGANILEIHFDDENINRYDELFNRLAIKSDAVITKDKNFYFLETDMGTEVYNTLRNKDKNYFQLISHLNKKDNLFNYKVVLYTSKNRIINLKENNIFENLDKNNLIEYYPN